MSNPLSQDDLVRLADMIHDKMRADAFPYFIDPKSHAEDHEAIQAYFRSRAEKAAAWQRIRESVIGWFIITVIGGTMLGVGAAVYAYAVHFVQVNGGRTP